MLLGERLHDCCLHFIEYKMRRLVVSSGDEVKYLEKIRASNGL